MEMMPQHPALRVGLLGTPTNLADILPRLAASLPPAGAAPLLRFLHDAATPLPATPSALPGGWTPHPIHGDDPGEVADLIVHNAEILIATDPQVEAAGGPVALALELGLPVLWVHGQDIRLLTLRCWRVARQPIPEGDAAWALLRQRIASLIARPEDPSPACLQQIEADSRLDRRFVWRAHRAALELLSRTAPAATVEPEPSLAWWGSLYAAADSLAEAYADRYRSSYTIVLALAAVALAAAVLGLRYDLGWTLGLIEAACLAVIILLVWANTRLDWRSRLIQCRLLAELCRKQAALTFIGRSLPATRIAGLTQEGGLAWIGWRFAAAVRAAPLPTTALAGAPLAAAAASAAAVLLRGQRTYHERRVAAGRRRERRLGRTGTIVFAVTALCVLIKLAFLSAGDSHTAEDFGLVAALLPAIAAALFGFRAYAEIELLVQQSERLVAVLEGAEATLAAIDTGRPGAGPQIGDLLEETAVEMLADVAGWIQISRVKAVEAA